MRTVLPVYPFFAQHVPGLERLAQFELHAAALHGAIMRKAKLALRIEPDRIEIVSRPLEVVQDLHEVVPDEMFQHVAVMQRRAPAR